MQKEYGNRNQYAKVTLAYYKKFQKIINHLEPKKRG